MRLIDADTLIASLDASDFDDSDPVENVSNAIRIIGSMETIDAVKIVRCKDCVSYGINTNNGKPLSYMCGCCLPNDFCSNGVKG